MRMTSYGDEPPIRIIGIGGSTRLESRTLGVLKAVLTLVAEQGAATTLADVRKLALPVYNEDIPCDEQLASPHWLVERMQRLQVPTIVTVGRAAMDDAFTGIGDDATRQLASRMVRGVILFVRMRRLPVLDETHHAVRIRSASVQSMRPKHLSSSRGTVHHRRLRSNRAEHENRRLKRIRRSRCPPEYVIP